MVESHVLQSPQDEVKPKKEPKDANVNFRVTKSEKELFQKSLKIHNERKPEDTPDDSMLSMVLGSIQKTNNGRDYDSLVQANQIKDHKIEQLEKTVEELASQTGKKVPTHKRISIPFTLEEYEKIVELQHLEKAKSLSTFLKSKLIHPNSQLGQIIPKQLE